MLRAVLLALLVVQAHAATVLCLGDSLTAGFGLDEDQAYPAVLAGLAREAGHPWTVINAGVTGDTSAGGRRRLAWALKNHPDVVLIALGGNDGLRGLSVDETRGNLAAIIDGVRAAGARPVLAGMQLPLNYGADYRAAFAAVYPALAAEKGVPLLPFLLEGVGGVGGLNQADGIHPTADGQRRIAATVYAFLAPLVDGPAP
jgi:acyl-CoA thioesterase-1